MDTKKDRPFNTAVIAGGFRSFSHQVTTYFRSLETLASELEDHLWILKKHESTNPDIEHMRRRLEKLLGDCVMCAKGEG